MACGSNTSDEVNTNIFAIMFALFIAFFILICLVFLTTDNTMYSKYTVYPA